MLASLMGIVILSLCWLLGCHADPFGYETINQDNSYPYGSTYGIGEPFPSYRSSGSDLQYVTKKNYPNFVPSYLNSDDVYSLPSEKKRFFAFHPMARFRGISLNSGGGSPSSSYSRSYQEPPRGFRSYSSSFLPSFVPSPSHPVPSEARSLNEDIEEPIMLESKPKFAVSQNEDPSTQGALHILNSMAPHYGSRGRNKISHFGME